MTKLGEEYFAIFSLNVYKLVRVIKMCSYETCSNIITGKYLSDPFPV
jgi:hypothetical protein